MDVKERILQKSNELFMQRGIKIISMDDIALALGMSKKTIYQYFENKDQLVEDVIRLEIDISEKTCKADTLRATNAIHEIILAIQMVEELFGEMNPNTLFDMQKYHPKAFMLFINHKNDFLYNTVKANIIRGKSEGLYREEISEKIIASFRVESMMLIFNPEFINKHKKSLGFLETEITLNFLYGLVSLQGYKILEKFLKKEKL